VEHHENNRANLNPFRWRGKFWDEETGFYLMHSRFYDPMTGRFINADDPRMLFATATMGTANGGSNLFAYALNNPIMYYDPTGYSAVGNFFRGLAIGIVTTVSNILSGRIITDPVSNLIDDPQQFMINSIINSNPLHARYWIQTYERHGWFGVGFSVGGVIVVTAATLGVGYGAGAIARSFSAPPRHMRNVPQNQWRLLRQTVEPSTQFKHGTATYSLFYNPRTWELFGVHRLTRNAAGTPAPRHPHSWLPHWVPRR